MKVPVNVILNGEAVVLMAEEGERLLDTLRFNGHTEVKEGCGGGECGACTVAINGEPICSCCAFTQQLEGAEITTSLGVAKNNPHLIDTFLDYNAVQCGFCTPGFVVSANSLLKKCSCKPLSTEQIKDALDGNICRCTGYHKIIEAVQALSEEVQK